MRFIKSFYLFRVVFFALIISLSSCEKIETEKEPDKSTDISSEDIDKNKDDEDTPGNDDGNTDNNDGTDVNGGGGNPSDGDGGTEEPDNTGYETGDMVSVSEFLKKDIKCQVWLVGRIVGDCTRSKKYAEVEPPFTHSQAILLADNPDEKDIEKMVAVCLTTNKGMRSDLNLQDNPQNHNQYVAVFGFRDSYLGFYGIKKPDGYQFPVNIK